MRVHGSLGPFYVRLQLIETGGQVVGRATRCIGLRVSFLGKVCCCNRVRQARGLVRVARRQADLYHESLVQSPDIEALLNLLHDARFRVDWSNIT